MLTYGQKMIGLTEPVPTLDPNNPDPALSIKIKSAEIIDTLVAAKTARQATPPYLTAEYNLIHQNAVQEIVNASMAAVKQVTFQS